MQKNIDKIMSNVSIVMIKTVESQTADMKIDTVSIPRTNDVNYNNQKVSATNNDQHVTAVVINSNSNAKNKQNDITKNACQPTIVSVNNRHVTTTNEITTLTRTITRNSCANINGHNIARSWYARCNRWRSQSCDRRKNTTIRYSWNTNTNRQV